MSERQAKEIVRLPAHQRISEQQISCSVSMIRELYYCELAYQI